MGDNEKITTTKIQHEWDVPGCVTVTLLVAAALPLGFVLGQLVFFVLSWAWWGKEPSALFSDTGALFGLALDTSMIGYLVWWFMLRTKQVIGVKERPRRRKTSREKAGISSFAYSISAVGNVLARSIDRRRMSEMTLTGDRPLPTVVPMLDRFILSGITFVAPNGTPVDSDVFIRWARAVERMDKRLGPGRGASENYWTRTYKRSSGLDWWPGPQTWYACLGLVEEAQYKLPAIIDEARRFGWHGTPPHQDIISIIYFEGNYRRFRFNARRLIMIIYAVHFKSPVYLYEGIGSRQIPDLPH